MQVSNEPSSTTNESGKQKNEVALWPLAYRLHTPTAVPWWSYRLYQTLEGSKVQVLYSKNKTQSEEIAQTFLDEPVVGFDMEWPTFVRNSDNPPLQKRIGLIQVASETTIALFHIGLHPGKTTDEIIAPSLKKLIESQTIAKTGVGILGADFARLRRYFGLNPQGAFELSHLDRLVKFSNGPYDLLNTKMVALANLVQDHLGLPLKKDSVRTSNWSKPLTDDQRNYAASDAYAGFMLFHCMNAKRLALQPVPGLPLFADQYSRRPKNNKGFEPMTTLMIHSTKGDGSAIAAIEFFTQNNNEPSTKENASKETKTSADRVVAQEKKPAAKRKAVVTREPLGPIRQILYDQLSRRRKMLSAQEDGLPLYCIANNSVLWGIAQRLPKDKEELLEVKGMGHISVEKYGEEWLEVVEQHIAVHGVGDPVDETSNLPTEGQRDLPSTPTQGSQRRRTNKQQFSDSQPAFSSSQRTPVLHTGLSFTFGETRLDVKDSEENSPSLMGRLGGSSKHEGIEMIDLTGDTPQLTSRFTRSNDNIGQESCKMIHTNGASRSSPNSSATSEDSSAFETFYTPSEWPPSSLKRKRAKASLGTNIPNGAQNQQSSFESISEDGHVKYPKLPETVPVPLSLKSKIFRNKLLAFSKLVTRKISTSSSGSWNVSNAPIVSESTLDLIVLMSPSTLEELNRVPGIERFAEACEAAQMDLLKNIVKFTPTRG